MSGGGAEMSGRTGPQTDGQPTRSTLLFAYACDPDAGSEPGAGFSLAIAAAALSSSLHVITRDDGPRVKQALSAAVPYNVTFHFVQRPKRGPTYFRYAVWVWRSATLARSMLRKGNFDVVHHATYASDWFPNPLVLLRKGKAERWVWGPAGGASRAPAELTSLLGSKAATNERVRAIVTSSLSRLTNRKLRKLVDHCIALNNDSVRGFRAAGYESVTLSSNLVLDYRALSEVFVSAQTETPRPHVLWASRGLEWKGFHVALSAFALLPDDWTVTVVGPGTDTAVARSLVKDAGAQIGFHGSVSRAETLSLIAGSDALVLPSLHDSAPWVAGEAAGLGVPVVCLDVSGVAAMAGPAAVVVPCMPVASLTRRLASAIVRTRGERCEPWEGHTLNNLTESLGTAYGDSFS